MTFELRQKLMLDGRIRCIALRTNPDLAAEGYTKVKFLIRTKQQAGNAVWYSPYEVATVSTERLRARGRGC